MSIPGPTGKAVTTRVGKVEFVLDERYRIIKKIGAGAFGCVVSAEDKISGRKVLPAVLARACSAAVTKLHGAGGNQKDLQRLRRPSRCKTHSERDQGKTKYLLPYAVPLM